MVDERIVEIRGASLKVLNALKSVLGLLRKFLVDHGVLHLFERKVIFVVVVAACFIMHQDESSFNVLMELIFLLLIYRTEQQIRCRIVLKKTQLPTIMLFQ
jgi:small basic protein